MPGEDSVTAAFSAYSLATTLGPGSESVLCFWRQIALSLSLCICKVCWNFPGLTWEATGGSGNGCVFVGEGGGGVYLFLQNEFSILVVQVNSFRTCTSWKGYMYFYADETNK